MNTTEHKRDIDYRTIRLIIGLIPIALALVVQLLSSSPEPLESVSAAYWDSGPWARNFLVGLLFIISAFMLAYKGSSTIEKWLAKLTAVAALGVALFPCDCDLGTEIIKNVHYISAGLMFTTLAIFCCIFFKRSSTKGWKQARIRSVVYATCCVFIVLPMLGMFFDSLTNDSLSNQYQYFTFLSEAIALHAFGIAWLTASKILPLLARDGERLSLF